MIYEHLKKRQVVEACRERQVNIEEWTKTPLADLLFSAGQKRNDGPGSQHTSNPMAKSQ